MKKLKIIVSVLIFLISTEKSSAVDPEKTEKVYHRVLLFAWPDSLSADSREQFLTLFEGLPAQVDGFESCSINEIEWSMDGFQTVAHLCLTDLEAVKVYEAHPDHQKIMQMGETIVKKFSMFNYWEE